MKQVNYSDVRNNLKTGDLIAFGGHTFISVTIKMKTHSNVSHVGMVLRVTTEQADVPIIMIVESTSIGNNFAGVRISRLSTRVANYNGDIWILPIAGAININGLETFLVSKLGIPYDYKQAIGSAFDFSLLPDQKEDLNKLFCSELCNEAYSLFVKTDFLIPKNSSKQTPIDVCRLPIYTNIYQVSGKERELI